MDPLLRWQDPAGKRTINCIIKKRVPQWNTGLRDWQLPLVAKILDGEDVLCCTATGDGKSALFAAPIIVLREMSKCAHEYENLPYRALPVGLVITLTKGLSANIVKELAALGVSALAYCQETVTEARKAGHKLTHEIKECKMWSVICIDPEHLKDPDWREITDYPVFRSNIVYGCVDEAHLIKEWGRAFRLSLKLIGAFFRGRLPPRTATLALSATLQPGESTDLVTDSLGMTSGTFTLLRRSNERPNTQLIVETLTHGLGGRDFPCLLPYLNSGRKTVIHCRTMEMVFRGYIYCMRVLPGGAEKMARVKMYHSLLDPEENEETLRLLEEDPDCQIAFANGLNIKTLLDSISLGVGDTMDQMWQEKGRVGRDPSSQARGVILVQQSVLAAAETRVEAHENSRPVPLSKKRRGKRPEEPMELAKALFLTEKTCYVASCNRIYGNLPLESSTTDCITAERPLPCSLCCQRSGRTPTLEAVPFALLTPFPAPEPSEAAAIP
ncbi:hypothetical protein FIBSPDRAFT_1044497 [Athelia psychrophila]|uniref:DNA 3'-5' helicase n=1 Tax=Athelia psychrophila TaxID=1759441 RepID=A0A166JJC6_9AGAM|nr:hypothetical protein FIBSPDRAFT_1044497 [Fibularhizoctonia sp. CBS 109695]